MRELAKDISYRLFLLVLVLVFLYFLPVLAHLFGDFMAAVFVPLLENTIQNMSNG